MGGRGRCARRASAEALAQTSMPGPRSAAIVGRILAEAARAFATTLAAVALGLVLGAEFGGAVHLLGVLVVLAFVAVSAGAVGVMLGHLVETPQGAFSFAPLVMAAMFFNTAMMPREMYAAVLRPPRRRFTDHRCHRTRRCDHRRGP